MSKPAETIDKVETFVWSGDVICQGCREKSVLTMEIPITQEEPEWPQKCNNCDCEFIVYIDDF